MSENEPKLTPEAIKYLNKMAAQQGDAPSLSPQSIRFLNSRLEGLAAMQKIIPAVLGLLFGAFLIRASLPTFSENVYEVFTTKAGAFTLENLFIQTPGWYSDTVQAFAMSFTGFVIVGFIVHLVVKKSKSSQSGTAAE